MKIELNKVTWYSKILALLLVITLPILGFKFGLRYGESIGFEKAASQYINNLPSKPVIRSQETSDRPQGRIVLTPDYINTNLSDNKNRCDEKFNADPADSEVVYSSSKKGISIKIPYNASWGNETYSIQPYDELNMDSVDQIAFGPIGIFEGCGWVRSWFLRFMPVQTAETVIETAKADSGCFDCNPEVLNINKLPVVKYTLGGLCTYPTMVVIGKKYNYELTPLCGDESSFDKMQSIIETAAFLD